MVDMLVQSLHNCVLVVDLQVIVAGAVQALMQMQSLSYHGPFRCGDPLPQAFTPLACVSFKQATNIISPEAALSIKQARISTSVHAPWMLP